MQYMALAIQTVFFLCSIHLAPGQNGSRQLVTSSGNPRMSPVMVIGFVGGLVRHDDIVHSGVQLAQHLRRDYPSDICVEVFENRRRERAHQQILRLLDTNHDGRLSVEEKHSARIVIYGMSWGGAETVMLALLSEARCSTAQSRRNSNIDSRLCFGLFRIVLVRARSSSSESEAGARMLLALKPTIGASRVRSPLKCTFRCRIEGPDCS